MTQLEAFLARCDVVAARLQITRTALSNRLLFDSRRLDLIAQGKDIGVRRLQRALTELREMEDGLGIEPPTVVHALAPEQASAA